MYLTQFADVNVSIFKRYMLITLCFIYTRLSHFVLQRDQLPV